MAIDNENLEMVRFWIDPHPNPDPDPGSENHDLDHFGPDNPDLDDNPDKPDYPDNPDNPDDNLDDKHPDLDHAHNDPDHCHPDDDEHDNDHQVELLLENKVETKDALLHAINEEYVEAVEVL